MFTALLSPLLELLEPKLELVGDEGGENLLSLLPCLCSPVTGPPGDLRASSGWIVGGGRVGERVGEKAERKSGKK